MKILAAYAHPADAITDCGGTLALHAQRGDDVVILCLSHGGRMHPTLLAEEWRKANPDPRLTQMAREGVIALKRDELKRAAHILGVERIITFDYEDNYVGIDDEIVERTARVIAEEQPDVILMDYPLNAAMPDPHTLASMMILTALRQVAMYVKNLDGRHATNVKQVFFTKLPIMPRDALTLPGGLRNDLLVDITSVVGKKVEAMDQFVSQGYDGDFARKLIESWNGEYGRTAGVNFAEAYCRLYNETVDHLPVTEYAMKADHLTAHRTYSEMNLRALFPVK